MRSKLLPLLALATAWLPNYSFAQSFHVSSTSELRAALEDAALNGQDDTIYLAAGSYKTTDDGQGTFIFSDIETYDITLKGESSASVIIDGDASHNILKFSFGNKGATATVEDITVQNGLRGIEFDNTIGVIRNATVQNNTLTNAAAGAGVKGLELHIESTVITNNHINDPDAPGQIHGAGIYAYDDLYITDSTISHNKLTHPTYSPAGAGLYTSKELKISNSEILSNTISAHYGRGTGSGIYSHGATTIEDTLVKGNTIVGAQNASGAGVYGGFSRYGQFIVRNSRIENNLFIVDSVPNVSGYQGGGIARAVGGYFRIENTLIINNGSESHNSVYGSGIFHQSDTYSYGTQLSLVNSAVLYNKGGSSVFASGPRTDSSQIINTVFDGNDGIDVAGGIFTLYNNYLDTTNHDATTIYKKGNISSGSLAFDGDSFQPTADSVLIDAGYINDEFFLMPTTDALGKRRIYNGAVDIGPYEFGAGFDEPIINSVNVSGEKKVTRELTFSITAQAIEGRSFSIYDIDYGFGSFNSVAATSTYTYSTPGTYDVVIRITDNAGDTATWPLELVVVDLALEDKLELAKQEGLAEGLEIGRAEGFIEGVSAGRTEGFAGGVNDVINNPSNYGHATVAEMNAAVIAAQNSARQYVIDNPEEFGLISSANIQEITAETIFNLTTGSHLIGSTTSISDLSIFNSATIIWTYQNGQYKAYTSSPDLGARILAAGYELTDRIDASAGIWVIKE